MLLTSLEGKNKSTFAIGIGGGTYDAAWHLADKFLASAKVANVRTAKVHRDTKTLSVAHCNVDTPLGRSLNHTQRACRAVHNEQCFVLMAEIGPSSVVLKDSEEIG